MWNKGYLRPTIIPLEREFGEYLPELITLLELTTNTDAFNSLSFPNSRLRNKFGMTYFFLLC